MSPGTRVPSFGQWLEDHPDVKALLGHETDGAIAKRAGVHFTTVSKWRRILNIPPVVGKGRPHSSVLTIAPAGYRGGVLHISSAFLRQIGLTRGDRVKVGVEDGTLIVRPYQRRKRMR